ncbi:MAG: hypothetical protein VYE15_02350 [Myxococcota bacterium]|nr:hypothetical protein [Myxococcota bacterium]
MSWSRTLVRVSLTVVIMLFTVAGIAAPAADGSLGTELSFHGWSPDSTYVAYTRVRSSRDPRNRRATRTTERHAHRRVAEGQLQPFGTRFGKDAGRFARKHGYLAEPAPLVSQTAYERRYETPEGVYVFRLRVGEDLGWELTWQGQVLMERSFDTLYVDVKAELYPSPDRRHIALVLHLNNGWMVDGGFYVAELPPGARSRWQISALVGPPAPVAQ